MQAEVLVDLRHVDRLCVRQVLTHGLTFLLMARVVLPGHTSLA
ncbi:hypothetical protein [Amycolatopsis sp. FBCC-B4732]|nr:hypothetical protein [Amycolatopsis sp. FBCC-B4732]